MLQVEPLELVKGVVKNRSYRKLLVGVTGVLLNVAALSLLLKYREPMCARSGTVLIHISSSDQLEALEATDPWSSLAQNPRSQRT